MSAVGKWNKPWRGGDDEPLIHFCPICGSTEITWIGALPILAPHMECKECGHRGVFILSDKEMIRAIRENYLKGKAAIQEDEPEGEDD